ncbi:hypothetical protein AB9P05_21050 [Roseivirga sp. BDSF3-8]|uniref:hypothetical protein n=1 Tax=Roseivirga sp. BDSF3-8 TaxID=3241598 RepID=UPI0035327FC2
MHIYEPGAETYLPDANPMPVAIDDHVQAVYRDSLLYLVSGWHDTANVNTVQIYDPANDTWQQGSALPESPGSYVFGASGIIVGDTLYMAGGAGNRTDGDFPVQPYFTKGYIHPEDPTLIDWTQDIDPKAGIYRSAAFERDGKVVWLGGSVDSYNYDGISYRGKPVNPRAEALVYNPVDGSLSVSTGFLLKVMDLRGTATFSTGEIYIAGGMLADQVVTDSLQILTY